MPNGTSLIGRAKSMTTSVAMCLDNTHRRMEEYLKHLESRKAHLEALLLDSDKADVHAMLAVVEASIASVTKAMALVADAAKRATAIEARL